MKIVVLSENTAVSSLLQVEHGLSLYIETADKKILFDTGASDIFAKNAKIMGIDLSQVDYAIISHGHYDHGGGISKFLSINQKAPVYIRENAFQPHYSLKGDGSHAYIGLSHTHKEHDRFIFTGNEHKIAKGIELFSGVPGKGIFDHINKRMKVKVGEGYLPDQFTHEQNLVIEENDGKVLFCGCAHCGILNIIGKHIFENWHPPKFVFGGFHLSSFLKDNMEAVEEIREMGRNLSEYDTTYFTCHCTGEEAFKELKAILGDNLHYIAAGNSINLEL